LLEQFPGKLAGLLPRIDMRPDLSIDKAANRRPELLVLRLKEV
jgi:hypothetical protein